MTDVKQLGHFIRETRLKRGLTQQQLADRVGVNASTITRYEQGKFTEVKWAVVREILKVLGITATFQNIVDLPDGIDIRVLLPRSEKEEFINSLINENLLVLNEEGLKKVFDYVSDLIGSGKYKTHDIKSEEPKLESEK